MKIRIQELRSLTGGVFGKGSERENKINQGVRSQEEGKNTMKVKWHWWIMGCNRTEESQGTKKEGLSIFRAQANEIHTDRGMQSLTFQYQNLHNWVDVITQF